jgi:hypothetical protein
MKKQLLLSVLLLSSYFLLVGSTFAKSNCTGYDITFNNVTVTGISKSNVFYNYTINNIGTLDMSLSKIVLQNYISIDNVFGGEDLAAGGSIISISGSVAAGASYSGIFEANNSNNTGAYKYLIVRLSYSDGECNLTNNEIIVCLKPDAQFTSLAITGLQTSSIDYNFEIKNVGGDTLFFNKLAIQNYLSVDNSYQIGDAAAGGSLLSFTGKNYLLPNESYSNSYSANGANAAYQYIIATLSYTGTSECNLSNNQEVEVIQAPNGIYDGGTFDGNHLIVWDNYANTFSIKEWVNIPAMRSLEYKLYTISGVLQMAGSTKLGESTKVEVREGVYILVISDGQKSYFKKIIN